ncbi:MAG: hypothetical protein H6R23_571, partial [Proteobacteria bacterium]|nr:hypothetical protein [Pseudomonadota bacterium]
MGRLFWKFFFAFWLALLVAGAGVGAAVWLHQQPLNERGEELASGPRTAFLVNATAATLRHGGIAALRSLLEEWRDRGRGGAHVYVVDDADQELLGRAVPAEALAQARRLAQEDSEQRIARLESADQRHYLFFIPTQSDMARHGPPPSPLLP